ncbi:helix-turn-helix domain-containing protein [Salinisphaera sp. LB1]|uniref:helix-turn-helix transcriptional regulator n=1 Tax=Salinisphaera sp. LB1 TaxID=2183911 RepID=UPI000D705B38
MTDSKTLTTRSAALYLGISESWLRQRRCYGPRHGEKPGPPYVKLGGAIRYRRTDLDLWLADQLVVTSTDPEGRETG